MTPLHNSWDLRFMGLAQHIATWSKDPSTKVGCVIVNRDHAIISTGFNGFPRGVADTEERLNDKELKYPIVCHAEENAILQAARVGVSVNGCVLYTTLVPCTRCARALIQAGINEVICVVPKVVPNTWRADFERSERAMNEAKILVRKM